MEIPELRRVYLPFPRPHLCEYPTSVATVLIAREYAGEPFHFAYTIPDPASLPLNEIDTRITHAAERPLEQNREFRRAVTIARLPTPVRRCLTWLGYNIGRRRQKHFGTFAVTVPPDSRISGWLSAWTLRLSYGRIENNGDVEVRVTVDHRVVDGPTGAQGRLTAVRPLGEK